MEKGLSPHGKTTINKSGGAQTEVDGRYDLVPGSAISRIAEVAGAGARKYAANNWRLIPYEEHINHALMHLAALLEDDTQDDHLGHALCRLAFAVAVETPEHRFKDITAGLSEGAQ